MFEFDNSKSVPFEHDGRAYYIKISKFSRTIPFPDMKQPAQPGCSLGVGYMLEIKHNGLPAEKRWRLYEEGQLVAEGYTAGNGKFYGLPIQLLFLGIKRYGFELITGDASVAT